MTNTIPVWVMPTDHEDTPWAINNEFQMEEAFADHLDQINDTFTITITINGNDYDFDPAPTLEKCDPLAYRREFSVWRSTWTQLDMPESVYNGDGEQAWVTEQMEGRSRDR